MRILSTIANVVAAAFLVCNGPVGQGADRQISDRSTPEALLSDLKRACCENDDKAFYELTYDRNRPKIPEEAVAAAPPMTEKGLSYLCKILSQLEVRQVDGRMCALGSKQRARLEGTVRVLCKFRNEPRALEEGVLHVFVLYFGRHDDRWKWDLSAPKTQAPWQRWEYDQSTPIKAFRSVRLAIAQDDYAGMFDMLEKSLVAGVARAEFISALLFDTERVSPATGETEGAPYVARGPHWASVDLESDALVADGVRTARVWRRRPTGERVAEETFVFEDGAWRWRPKPQYTLWAAGASGGLFQGARHIVMEREGKWERYTRDFVERFNLDEDQTQAALRILKVCKELRTQYLLARRAEIRKLETALVGENSAKQSEQALEGFERLRKPIQKIFEERLRPGLDKLPTRKQRDAVGEEATP